MQWLDHTGVALAAFMWMLGPGLLFGLAAKLRGLALFGFAPVASTALLAVSALAFPVIGVAWSPATAAAAIAVLVLVAWGLRVGLSPSTAKRERTEAISARWIVPAGIAIGAVLSTLRLTIYIGAPDSPSQTNDGVFHLNALRYILDTGSASSLDLTGMLGISSFYPAAWHALASLVAMTTGGDVVVAANVTSIVIGGLVWTVGLAWFTFVATRGDRLAAAAAAALSAAVASFPLLLIQWGVLYPSLLAVAVLPGALALVIGIPDVVRQSRTPARDLTWRILLTAVGLSAIALAQPAMLLVWAIVAASFGLWAGIRRWSSVGVGGRALMVAVAFVCLTVIGAAWGVFGWLTTSVWPASRGRVEAMLDIVGNGFVGFPAAWGVSILMVFGIFNAVRVSYLRWLATSWAVLAVLYYVVAAVGNPLVRSIVAPFYADPYRIAAVLPLVVLPLAGVGLSRIVAWAQARMGVTSSAGQRVASGTLASGWALSCLAALGVISIVTAPIVSWRDVWTDITDRVTWYEISDSTYLTSDERDLLDRLPELVPGELIVGNPSTGMALGYALANQSMYPLSWQPPQTEAYGVLASSLNMVSSDPLVCPAVDSIGARYVIDFGPGDADYGRYVLPGFTGFEGSDGFELVDRQGQAALWRITACD